MLQLTGGVLLVVLGVATLALAGSGRLTLYVHPRYVVLSVVLATVALTVATTGLVLRPAALAHATGADARAVPDEHSHEHPQNLPPARVRRPLPVRARLAAAGRVLLLAAVIDAVLVVPPATLSTALTQDRGLATDGRALEDAPSDDLVGADTSTFTLRDWAALLQQNDPDAVAGRSADLTGYVLDRGQDDSFVLARLMISCCAVDAQPIGVPVRRPGWRTELKPGTWIQVQGSFADNAGSDDANPTVMVPTSVVAVPEPKNPYVF